MEEHIDNFEDSCNILVLKLGDTFMSVHFIAWVCVYAIYSIRNAI